MVANKEETLFEVLTRLGYTTRSAGHDPVGSSKEILNGGLVVFRGTAHRVWEWLHITDQYKSAWMTAEEEVNDGM